MWPRTGPIPTYGVLYLLGIIAHLLIAGRLARKFGLRRRVWIAANCLYFPEFHLTGNRLRNTMTTKLIDWGGNGKQRSVQWMANGQYGQWQTSNIPIAGEQT